MKHYPERTKVYGGPYSIVYKAVGPDDAPICLKVVDTDFNCKPHLIRDEIRLLKLMDHPSILPFLDTFSEMEDMVLVTPFYPLTLTQLIDAKSRRTTKYNMMDPSQLPTVVKTNTLDTEFGVPFLRAMAGALAYLHERHVIHRDVKPDNIYFAADSFVPVLGDFGVAWDPVRGEGDEPAHEKYTDVCTGIYKAPELCFGYTEYGPEIDVWSLAVVMTVVFGQHANKSVIDMGGGNDIALVSSVFKVLGTPVAGDVDGPLGWPTMALEKYHFTQLKLAPNPRLEMSLVFPRCPDSNVLAVLDRMLSYEGLRRPQALEVEATMAAYS